MQCVFDRTRRGSGILVSGGGVCGGGCGGGGVVSLLALLTRPPAPTSRQ